MDTTRARILQEISKALNVATEGRVNVANLSEDLDIVDDLGLNSLDILEMVYEMETQWNLNLSDADYGDVSTVGHVVDLILEHASAAHLEQLNASGPADEARA